MAACAALATPSAQALDVFTGNAPVFMGAWFNGSFTEVHEFQFGLDWAGWCNAHAGATCSNHRYWNVAGNWDQGAVPGAASDVRVEAGHTVRVGQFSSFYQGPISGGASAGVLSSSGRVELYGLLRVGNASFADLHNDRDNGGTLETTGLATIGLLSSGAGRFQGAGGLTRVQAFTPSSVRGLFEPLVRSDHTLEFNGTSLTAGMAVQLEPTARFINSGTLDMAGGSVGLQGTASFNQLPSFVNQGALQGSGAISGVKFENQGQIQLGAGQALAMGSWGEHSGHFTGSTGSTMSFAGIGSAGHRFAAGSSVSSLGAVNFGVGDHRVQGHFSAASASLNIFGTVTFEGARPQIGSFQLGGDGTVALRTSGGAAIQALSIDGGFSRFDVDAGAPLDLGSLRLVRGSFNAITPVSIAGNIEWASGWINAPGGLTTAGNWQLLAGDRILRGQVINSGNVSWEGGRFTEWSGSFFHHAGSEFDIQGDFNSAGGLGGYLINAGRVSKLAGAGRSQLAMAFDNLGGTVRALSGTLALTGGGVHTNATFTAAPGAVIELAGGTTFSGSVSVSGRLDLSGGDLTLGSGVSYSHAAGNRFDVANLSIEPGASLSVADALRATGNVTNLGSFRPAGNIYILGNFAQQGNFALSPGRALNVDGVFSNDRPLTVTGGSLSAGVLVNHSTLSVIDSGTLYTNSLNNLGTLVLGPANGFPGVSAFIASGINSGTLRVDGTQVSVSSYDLQNTGLIANEGAWYAGGSFTQYAGGRFDNAGTLNLSGTTTLYNTASIANGGSLTLQDGVLAIDAGAQISGPGSFVQLAGLTHVNGRLQAGGGIDIQGGLLKGTGTVEGWVNVGPAGQWKPGNSPGTMTVTGDAYLMGGLEIEVESSALFDRLLVSGGFNAYSGSVVDFVFASGYRPRDPDSDSIAWISTAGSPSLQGSVNFSGLPSQWSATLATDGQIQLSYDLAVQIPTRGSHSVAAGEVHFNALGTAAADYPLLDRLDNAGYFHNRAGAGAYSSGEANNLVGASLVNRGELGAHTLNNAGQLNNRAGGSMSVGVLNNSGVLINEGQASAQSLVNEAGAVLEQRGTMQVFGMADNRGRLVVAGPLTGMLGFNNSGDVHILAGGSIEGRQGGWFWHSAGELRVDGLLAADDISVFGGNLRGNGVVRGTLSTFGPVEPGNSTGQLTVEGSLLANGPVNLEIASASDFDRLVVSGDATLAGGVSMYLLGSYRPQAGDSFSFFSVGGSLQLNPANWVVLRLVDSQDPASGWTPWADAAGIYGAGGPSPWRAEFGAAGLSITAVPEPQSWALMMAGVGVVAWLARRRRRCP